MSKRFFTSDLHLGSTLISKYASRPFTSAEDALHALCGNINQAMSKTDVLIHAGDFMQHGKDSHRHEEDISLGYKLDDYLSMLQPNVFLLAGNHDYNNKCEPMAENMWVNLNQNYKHVFVSHFPSYHKFYYGPTGKPDNVKIALCGHVHDSWLMYYDAEKNVLNYNVGVDVHSYKPVQDSEITQDLDFIFKHKFFFLLSGKLDRETMAQMKRGDEEAANERRKRHKAERYLKKGLTPEECERRKREAMMKKDLDPNLRKCRSKHVEDAFTHEDAMQFGCTPPDVCDPLLDQ